MDLTPEARMQKYMAMHQERARERAGKMLAKHGSHWLNAVAAVRDDAVGVIMSYNVKTNVVEVELFNGSGRVRFNSLEFWGIPAEDLWIGELVSKVPT